MKQRKPINKISAKRLKREFDGKIPFSTVGRSYIGNMLDFDSRELGSTPRRPAKPHITEWQTESSGNRSYHSDNCWCLKNFKKNKPIKKVSVKQRAKQAKLNEIRHLWWSEDKRECGICHLWIVLFEDYVLDHIEPRGMSGGKRDDSESNLQPAHWWCNSLKGAKRIR